MTILNEEESQTKKEIASLVNICYEDMPNCSKVQTFENLDSQNININILFM
jgi:hypothetical protein